MFGKIFIAILISLDYSNCLNLCGDWTQYKDIKCIKVLEKKGTEAEALSACTKLDQSSILLTIHSKDDQDYLNSLLEKYHNISLNVWLGMKYSEKAFKWIDGTNTDYNNWSEDAVKDGVSPCVEMSLQKESIGKWVDVSCKKPALIVCQKKQEFSLNDLKNALNEQQNQINNLTKAMERINLLIPIGFLYTQLPNQSSPQELWPNMKWTEVTKEYSGLFFRAEGGESLPFGQTQLANQSWISDVIFKGLHYDTWKIDHYTDHYKSLNRENWTDVTYINGYAYAVHSLDLYTTGGEIRPKNTAIRIYKRIS